MRGLRGVTTATCAATCTTTSGAVLTCKILDDGELERARAAPVRRHALMRRLDGGLADLLERRVEERAVHVELRP